VSMVNTGARPHSSRANGAGRPFIDSQARTAKVIVSAPDECRVSPPIQLVMSEMECRRYIYCIVCNILSLYCINFLMTGDNILHLLGLAADQTTNNGLDRSFSIENELIAELCEILPEGSPLRMALAEMKSVGDEINPLIAFVAASGGRDFFRRPAAVLWRDHKAHGELRDLDAPEFAIRMYGDRFHPTFGMTLTDLMIADRSLYVGLNNWRHAEGHTRSRPDALRLMDRSEAMLARLRLVRSSEVLMKVQSAVSLKGKAARLRLE
jgi:hypothetical protein